MHSLFRFSLIVTIITCFLVSTKTMSSFASSVSAPTCVSTSVPAPVSQPRPGGNLQSKLTAAEWEMTEMPLPVDEVRILKMIEQGFEHDPATVYPTLPDLYSFLKMERSKTMEAFLFSKYFGTMVTAVVESATAQVPTVPFSILNDRDTKANAPMVQVGPRGECKIVTTCIAKLKSSDNVRVQLCAQLEETAQVAECVLMHWWKQMVLHWCYQNVIVTDAGAVVRKREDGGKKASKKGGACAAGTGTAPAGYAPNSYLHAYFTLNQYLRMSRETWNEWVVALVRASVAWMASKLTERDVEYFLRNASSFLEERAVWMNHPNLQLYDHQQKIIHLFQKVTNAVSGSVAVDGHGGHGMETQKDALLVFYTAPTGTGKTMTPLAISMRYRVIYVCGARHIGLSLARCAISLKKRIAFAYGCECSANIRLHNFAAKVFTADRNGKIRRIDHSVGDNVDIMVCDVHSYLHAMRYMLAFNNKERLVVYWDEPTIAMHSLAGDAPQEASQRAFQMDAAAMWSQNEIPKWVLSSATLPSSAELHEMVGEFRCKFGDVQIETIHSHHYEKSVSIVGPDGYAYMPHYEPELATVRGMVRQLNENKSLRRYLDVKECGAFLYTVFHYIGNVSSASAGGVELAMGNFIRGVEELTMHRLKDVYCEVLEVLARGCATNWALLQEMVNMHRDPRIRATSNVPVGSAGSSSSNGLQKMQSADGAGLASKRASGGESLTRLNSVSVATVTAPAPAQVQVRNDVGMYITTSDAYTLTHGPTLFLTTEPQKISAFCFQSAGIPATILDKLKENIEHNVLIQKQIQELEEEMQRVSVSCGASAEKTLERAEKMADATGGTGTGFMSKMYIIENKVNALNMSLKRVALPDKYIPNTLEHLRKWVPAFGEIPQMYDAVFRSAVSEADVERIVKLEGVSNELKMLLLMGIGTVAPKICTTEYLEIMKRLAGEQRLYLVIADANYLHGTNYQFCHAYVSKDLKKQMTQEQLIQAMGRVGRAHLQNTYTVRMRDAEFARRLFQFAESSEKPEVHVMNALFGPTEEPEWDPLSGNVQVHSAQVHGKA